MLEKKDNEKIINSIFQKVRRAHKDRLCGSIQINFFMGGITNITTTKTEKPPFDEAA